MKNLMTLMGILAASQTAIPTGLGRKRKSLDKLEDRVKSSQWPFTEEEKAKLAEFPTEGKGLKAKKKYLKELKKKYSDLAAEKQREQRGE